MIRALICTLALSLVLAGECAAAGIASDVPLRDRPVEAPGPEIPKELAAFSGRWVGVWTNGATYRKNMALIIDRVIAPDRAAGFYGCGHALPLANPVCPSAFEWTARLEGGTLKIDYPAIRAEGRYRINGDVLEGDLVDVFSGRRLIWVTARKLP